MAKTFLKKKVEQGVSEEELNNEEITPDRVDINVLKSRIRAEENKLFRRNLYIFISCMIVIVIAGVYVTYL
ncbi:hypothetical protein [Candidatus Pelagibacter sp.]|uniref:hypothetical protein n=1 Tax=Candidatus Pelagibacter sp. TaxID=2024849 RepID=UPI003F82B9C1